MKRISISIALLSVLLSVPFGLAADKPFAEPILLTSCGQSADALMMKTLLTRDSLAFTYVSSAVPADVQDKGSVIIVLGGSSKGLGAAKISEADETARVSALMGAAEKAGVPVLAAHIGGANRRGPLSDPFNRLGAEHAARIIVVKGGNDDGFFTKIAETNKIPLDTVTTALNVAPLLLEIYRSDEASTEAAKEKKDEEKNE
ncbi:hypothetical protein KKH27_03320 [bacterium]|nr:hypothetical protein [bacterium]MBU1983938.1 hypothetical protein [bacterium]